MNYIDDDIDASQSQINYLEEKITNYKNQCLDLAECIALCIKIAIEKQGKTLSSVYSYCGNSKDALKNYLLIAYGDNFDNSMFLKNTDEILSALQDLKHKK